MLIEFLTEADQFAQSRNPEVHYPQHTALFGKGLLYKRYQR